jgi:hypothetical protein
MMTDWMSKIVLFETVDELTDYKKKIENRYKAKTEKYVGKLQEEYFDFEKCDLEDQARILVINALTEAWMLTGLQRIVDQRDGELTQEEAEKMIMSNALACAAVSIKYLSAKNIDFSSVILKLLKKDNIRALDENAINKYVKEYEKNRKRKTKWIDDDSMFCPPILYAPEVTKENREIKNFMIPIIEILVADTGIYYERGMTEKKTDEIASFGKKLRSLKNAKNQYKDKLKTQLNNEYETLIKSCCALSKNESMGDSISDRVAFYYVRESIFRTERFLDIASCIDKIDTNDEAQVCNTKKSISAKIQNPAVFYAQEFEEKILLQSPQNMVLFCEYMRIVTLLIAEGIYWIEQPKEKMVHADNLICDYINKNFTRFFQKTCDALDEKRNYDCLFEKEKNHATSRVELLDFVVDLYSLKDRYSKNVTIDTTIEPYYKRTGLDLGYEEVGAQETNCKIKIDGRSYLYTERRYGISYDLKTRTIKRKNAKDEECEWKEITADTIVQLATEIYEEQPLIPAGKDPEHERMYKIIIRRTIVKEICKDLEKLGVALTAEDMNMINSKCNDYYTAEEHAYIESVMFPNSQVSDET